MASWVCSSLWGALLLWVQPACSAATVLKHFLRYIISLPYRICQSQAQQWETLCDTGKECEAEIGSPKSGLLLSTCNAQRSCLVLPEVESNLSLSIPGGSRRRVAAKLIIASSLNQVNNVMLWKHSHVTSGTELSVGWRFNLGKGTSCSLEAKAFSIDGMAYDLDLITVVLKSYCG